MSVWANSGAGIGTITIDSVTYYPQGALTAAGEFDVSLLTLDALAGPTHSVITNRLFKISGTVAETTSTSHAILVDIWEGVFDTPNMNLPLPTDVTPATMTVILAGPSATVTLDSAVNTGGGTMTAEPAGFATLTFEFTGLSSAHDDPCGTVAAS